MIFTLKAEKLLRRVCEAFLASVVDTRLGKSKLEQIPIVKEYPDIFLEKLPRLTLEKDGFFH